MQRPTFTRATLGLAASVAVLAPFAACSGEAPPQPTSSATQDADAPEGVPSDGGAPDGAAADGTATGSGEYADGTYTTDGVYGGAPSYMTITLTLADDVITDATVEPMPENNDTSRGYQERFAAALPDEVIGRSVDEAEVGVLAGASGCADGFNAALPTIREEASTT